MSTLHIPTTDDVEVIHSKMEILKDTIQVNGDSIFFVARALSTEFVEMEVLEKDYWTFKGKELRWRHKIPELDLNAVIGHVHNSWFESEAMYAVMESWGDEAYRTQIQEMLLNGDLSISCGFIKNKNDKGKTYKIYGREISLTPTPQCTPELGCFISDIILLEQSNDNKNINNEIKEDKPMGNDKNVDTDVATKVMELFEKNESLKADLISKYKKENATLEATMEALDKRITELNQSNADKDNKIEASEKRNVELETLVRTASTLALRQEIIQLEQLKDVDAVNKRLEELSKHTPETLIFVRDTVKSAVEKATKITKSESSNVVLGQDGSGHMLTPENMSPEQLMYSLNPNLKPKGN